MTIYNVIDNHKDFGRSDVSGPIHWTILSGASILQGGNPFFIPDFAREFEARLTLAIRIGKLGKNIAPRFAHRYVEATAPCINFTATDLLKTLREAGLPWTGAVNFDRSAAFGRYEKCDPAKLGDTEIRLDISTQDGTASGHVWKASDMIYSAEDIISLISRDNTLKTGDIILIGTSATGPKAEIGQHFDLSIDGRPSVGFNIR